MDAAVIKFNSLADPVRSAAQNHNLSPVAMRRFVFFSVRRVVVRCVGFEFSRTGVDKSISRYYPFADAFCAHVAFGRLGQKGQLSIREAILFCAAQVVFTTRDFLLLFNNLANVLQEPWINPGEFIESADCETGEEPVADIKDSIPRSVHELLLDFFYVPGACICA